VVKLLWRVKLVAELQPGVTTETEVARIERDEDANLAELGLRLEEAKQVTAALQAQMVPAQVAHLGERRRSCMSCGGVLTSKGHYPVRFRSLFGDVPLRVRRLLICPCQGGDGAKSFAILDFGGNAVAPELAYITARYAALVPFGKVAALLSELLPMSGTQHASTVRNRMMRVGETVVQQHSADTAQPTDPVMVGLDGGYVRNRHGGEGRHFEVIAGKVIDAEGAQHRFAFVRNAPVAASDAFQQVLAAGARCGGGGCGDAGDGAVRWRCRAVAAAARDAAPGHGGAGLVAPRGALRACAAGRPRPRRRHRRHTSGR
jgi:hypothetical protein